MSKVREYYRLQQLDSDIDARTARLTQVEAALGQRDAVDAAQAAFEETQTALEKARHQQRDLEWDLDKLKKRLAQLEEIMYGGSVTNPKELDDMRQETEHLLNQRTDLQDQILEAMMTVEELEDQAGAQHEVWQGAEQVWAEEQTALQKERDALQEQLAALRVERQTQASRLDAAGIARYERLRAKLGSLAVVPLQGTVCTGCRLSLSSAEVQKVRADAMVNFCPNCGRMLVHDRSH